MAFLDELFASLRSVPPLPQGYAGGMPGGGQPAPLMDPETGVTAGVEDPFAALNQPRPKATPAAFGAGAAPLPFGGLLAESGLLNAPTAAAAPDLPPSTNDPSAAEPTVTMDGVPLPRPRPVSVGATPMSLAPRDRTEAEVLPAPARPTGPAPAQGPFDGIGSKISSGLGKVFSPANAPTLLALGGGFAGAPSVGEGMRRGFSGAAITAQKDRAFGFDAETMAATERALVTAGVQPALARAAARDPKLMAAIAPKYFETKSRVAHEIGTDWLGNKIMGSFDPNTGFYYDAAGRRIAAPDGADGGAGAAAGGGSTTMPVGGGMGSPLAKGVKAYNNDLAADEYLAQFSPEVQAAMKNYASGHTMPTGNPRLKGFAPKIKEWTQLWGDKSGQPMSDATFAEKRKFRTELGSATGGAGGQAKAFEQATDHALSLAQVMEKLGNWNGFGIPWVAGTANAAREAMSTEQAGLASEARSIGQTLAGEVGKLFSGQAGGGVHEREATAARFNSVKSGPELAGAIEGTIETMEGGLRALESRRDAVLGPNSDVTFLKPEVQAKIAKIREIVGRLRSGSSAPSGGAAAPAGAAPPGVTSTGVRWSVQP